MNENPSIASDLVHSFVANAHGDLDEVQRLLKKEPGLLQAAWDWGAGDWETGLGAASHMGRRDIANYLMGQGARLDLFASAMLGLTDIVRRILEAFPEMRDAGGPHGISLIQHAVAGGPQAEGVVRLLESTGVEQPLT